MKLVKAFKKAKKNSETTPLAVAPNRALAPAEKSVESKPVPVEPRPKPALPEMRCVPPAVPTPPTITIEALIDVGFGNQLFLRGQGAGLSWERGTPLACVDAQTWRWSVPTTDKLTFKLLLNDQVWARGEDIVATPGKCIGVVPRF